MVDSSKCFPLIRGKMARITRLDACGARVLGATSQVVTKGFVTVQLSAQTEEGEAIKVTNMNGDLCINDTPAPDFTGYNVEVNFCGVNPDLINMMSGMPIVYDSQAVPQGVGFRMNTGVDLGGQGFALELWSAVPGVACVGGASSYGYMLIPFLQGGILGDFTIENGPVSFTMTGAKTKDGNSWGVGINNVTTNNTGVATPLKTALDPLDHLHLELVTVAPPADVCGAIPLGVPATTATQVAGTAATLTPANSYAPKNFAALTNTNPTASPATNWTTGSYLLLGDGSKANWNGTAWAIGAHA